MKYIAASKGPGSSGPLIAMQQDVQKMIVRRQAAFPVEYGVKGRELQNLFAENARKFIRAMELQGLELIPLPGGNPLILTDEQDRAIPHFSTTRDFLKTAPSEADDALKGRGGAATLNIPSSLDDSYGFVDYTLVGVFWAPMVAIEIAKRRDTLLAEERAAKNPRTWGYGKAVPDRPSLA
jgi:hypothetical protein